MAMADLAYHSNEKPVSLTEISLRQNISLSYLEQLFIKLKSKKLVKGLRGSRGGYTLEKPASEIKLSNILDNHINGFFENVKLEDLLKENYEQQRNK